MRRMEFRRGGEVRLRAGSIHVDRPGEAYDPTTEPVEVELAKLLGPDRDKNADAKAEAFVSRFGVLTGRTVTGSTIGIDELRRHASELRNVYSLVRSLQRLRDKSRASRDLGLEELRRWAREHDKPVAIAVADARDDVAATISRHQEFVRYALDPSAEGFEWVTVPQHLLSYVYASVAEGIVNDDRIEVCSNREHREPFRVTDGRMR